MKFTTNLISLDFVADTVTFHLPPGTRMGAGTYCIEWLTAGQPQNSRPSEEAQEHSETAGAAGADASAALELKHLGDPEKLTGIYAPAPPWKAGKEFLPYHASASHVPPDYRDGWNHCYAVARSCGAWQPQFDAISHKQEVLVLEFCAEIAGPKGQPGRPPDPVRLLEMAQALYEAEREAMAP